MNDQANNSEKFVTNLSILAILIRKKVRKTLRAMSFSPERARRCTTH
jgi:hypothetical protein